MNRRHFLKGSIAAAATFRVSRLGGAEESGHSGSSPEGLIDTNVNLFRWPFRRLRGDSPGELAAILRRHGVKQAWAGSFEAILEKDQGGVNERLARVADEAGDGFWVPFGTVNPHWPDWEEELRRCVEDYGMPGLRLYPGYHRYRLDDEIALDLFRAVAKRQAIIQIPVVMEDPRTQHPLVQAPPVSLDPLVDLLAELPDLQVVIQNHRSEIPRGLIERLVETGRVYFDIARAERAGPIEKMMRRIPSERILFGSHSPFFYFEAARLKLEESELTSEQRNGLLRGNAERLLQTRSQDV